MRSALLLGLLLCTACSSSTKGRDTNDIDSGSNAGAGGQLQTTEAGVGGSAGTTEIEAGPPPVGDTCADAVDMNTVGTAQTDGSVLVAGTNANARTDLTVCDAIAIGTTTSDVVYKYTVAATGGLRWHLNHTTPTLFTVDVRTACDDATSNIDCDDCPSGCTNDLEVTAGETLFFVISGVPTTNSREGTGSFELSVLPMPDPAVGEVCTAEASGGRPCPTGSQCQQPVSGDAVCGTAVCGDGFLSFTGLECDDGNKVSNDGCSGSCTPDAQGGGGATCDAPLTLNLVRVRNILDSGLTYMAMFGGDFVGGSDLGASCSTAAGPEAVYVFQIDAASQVQISASNVEALSVRSAGSTDCGTQEIACTNGAPTAALSVDLPNLAPGRYSIILDREAPSAATTATYGGSVVARAL